MHLFSFACTLFAFWLSGIIDGFDFAIKSCLLAGLGAQITDEHC